MTHAAPRLPPRSRRFATAALAFLLAGSVSGVALPSAAAPAGADTLATVGESVITVQEYAMALRTQARQRFYHAKPPERELAAFYREVAERLIERTLAAQEAARQGMRPDRKAIEGQVRQIRSRLKQRGTDQHDNAGFWNALRKELEQEQLVARLQERVRAGLAPSEAALRGYYAAHPEKFTQPESVRVSVILLRVSPSAPQPAWEAARTEAEQIRARLRAGAPFSELARVHSGDSSSRQGGDLGFVHKGMLSASVEEAIAGIAPDQVTPPVMVLEGIALFKLHERRPARLSGYAQVRERVRQLWMKEQEHEAWSALMARLRSTTRITIEDRYLAPG